ncbi:MAG: C-GCAxxG-C-C family protein [Bacteroidota bacterium]
MKNPENAVELFSKGFNCAQAVFSTFSPSLGLNEQQALKIACPFGAGMGRMQGTCGAVVGAFLVLGLKYGRYTPEDEEAKEHTYKLVNTFTNKFLALHKTINCRELLGADMNTEEGQRVIKEQDLFRTRCLQYVKDAAAIVEELI